MTPFFRADLHCHSSCSDGSMTPLELIQEALACNLQGLSITDHDTIEAYATVVAEAHEKKLALISGIEFSSTHEGESVHILGYAFSLSSPAIQELCSRHILRREERNRQILEKLAALGMPLTMEEVRLEGKKTVGRPHIALAMVKRKYVSTVQEAFRHFIGEGRPGYAVGNSMSVEETLDAIHAAKGVAVLAHPHLIQNISLLNKLMAFPFNGIECYYARFSDESNQPWIELAKKKGWLMTGGSDFHGAIKPGIPLGASWIGEQTFKTLWTMHQENNC